MNNLNPSQQGGINMPLLQIRRNFQITLPAKLRQALELKEGDLVEAELVNNQAIILKPKEVVSKARDFSTQEISTWLKEDKLDKGTLTKAKKLAGNKK